MSRQLRRKNDAADVVDWVSAMQSVYNLLVEISGSVGLFQECSSPGKHHTIAFHPGTQHQLVKRRMETRMEVQAPERKFEPKTSTEQRQLVTGMRKIDKITSSCTAIPISAPDKERASNEITSMHAMQIDEQLFPMSLPLPSQTGTPFTETTTRAGAPAGDRYVDLSCLSNVDKDKEPPPRIPLSNDLIEEISNKIVCTILPHRDIYLEYDESDFTQLVTSTAAKMGYGKYPITKELVACTFRLLGS